MMQNEAKLRTFPSCCSADCAVSSGLTMRNQKLALVAPQKRSSNQADCKSGTAGIRWNNSRCSVDFPCTWASTYAELPMGATNTRTPSPDREASHLLSTHRDLKFSRLASEFLGLLGGSHHGSKLVFCHDAPVCMHGATTLLRGCDAPPEPWLVCTRRRCVFSSATSVTVEESKCYCNHLGSCPSTKDGVAPPCNMRCRTALLAPVAMRRNWLHTLWTAFTSICVPTPTTQILPCAMGLLALALRFACTW